MRRALVVLALVALVGSAAACELNPVAGELPAGPEVPPGTGFDARLAGLVAQHRAALGCGPIVWMEPVAAAAERHASDMATQGWWGHQGPGGESMQVYLQAHGIAPRLAGDALARNFVGPDAPLQVFRAWLNSPPHRVILEDCRFQAHGAGYSDGLWAWYGVR